MVYYCSTADVAQRLGLDASQRTRAGTRLTSCVRRATIMIDVEYRDYGRDAPSRETAETTLDGAHAAGTTTIDLASGGAFGVPGNGNIDGDSFAWTGRAGNQLTGVTGVSADHADGVTVQQGEFAHVLREVCADLAAGIYYEDETTFHQGVTDTRHVLFKERGLVQLRKIAHLGTLD